MSKALTPATAFSSYLLRCLASTLQRKIVTVLQTDSSAAAAAAEAFQLARLAALHPHWQLSSCRMSRIHLAQTRATSTFFVAHV
jgi:hypothetical protein